MFFFSSSLNGLTPVEDIRRVRYAGVRGGYKHFMPGHRQTVVPDKMHQNVASLQDLHRLLVKEIEIKKRDKKF